MWRWTWSEYDQKVSTELYYQDPDTKELVMYQTLFGDENRIWVDFDSIPKNLRDATIAIEDKRFESHHGVDWHGTVRAVFRTLTKGNTQGGSTITQQLIKNVTGNNENTVKRKVTEVYRALALEKDYSKDEILEMYLNTIYLGNQCYGVQTASRTYFHKDVSELTLAECACLISITNNPSQYDPLRSDWTREQNRNRPAGRAGRHAGPRKRSTRPPMTPPKPRRWYSPTATPTWATMWGPRRRTKSPPWSAPPTTPTSPTRSSPMWPRSLWRSLA